MRTPLQFRVGAFVLVALASTSCQGTGYLANRTNDFADSFVLTATVGPEVSAGFHVTDLAHVLVGGGLHSEAGLIGREPGNASIATLGLPFVPFIEGGILHGRYVFAETTWDVEDIQDECYLVHVIDHGHTNPPTDLWHAYDLEVSATVLVGGRIGFSAGEFVDFLAGIIGLDPIGDDRSSPEDASVGESEATAE